MIRKTEEKDFLDILYLCELFWDETEYNDVFDPNYCYEVIHTCYQQGLSAVIDKGGVVGFISGIAVPLLGNGQSRMAVEQGFYILPEHRGSGLKLLRFYEKLVREQSVKYSVLTCLQSCEPDKAQKLYEHEGYHLSERNYLKVM